MMDADLQRRRRCSKIAKHAGNVSASNSMTAPIAGSCLALLFAADDVLRVRFTASDLSRRLRRRMLLKTNSAPASSTGALLRQAYSEVRLNSRSRSHSTTTLRLYLMIPGASFTYGGP